MREKAEDEEGEDEDAEGGWRKEDLTGVVFGAGVQTLREYWVFAWLAWPKARRPARRCARIYARPLAWGRRGAKGRAVRCLGSLEGLQGGAQTENHL